MLLTKSYYLSAKCLCVASLSALNGCTTDTASSKQVEKQVLSDLNTTERPVKVVADTLTGYTYWLDFAGNIYRIAHDSQQRESVVRSTGTEHTTLFVADFCLDISQQYVYFTDLRDPETGKGAIKRIDLATRRLTTVAVFPQEVPYRVAVSPTDGRLYYFTRELHSPYRVYRLGVLGRSDPLVTSSDKLTGLERWVNDYLKPTTARRR